MRPYSVAIDLTYRCNLRCLHCYNQSGSIRSGKAELTEGELIILLKDIASLAPQSVCFCGGEPTIRKEMILSGTQIIKQNSAHTNVNFVTNGQLLQNEDYDKIQKAGITMVQVSLDGVTPQTHDWMRGQAGVFSKACSSLKGLNENGVVTAVSFIPTKRNVGELEQTIALCESLGVSSFRVQPLMVMGRARKHLLDYILSPEETKRVINILNRKSRENAVSGKMEITWGDPIEHLINLESNLKFPSFTIGAYGDIILSPYIPIAFGNVRKHAITEYVSAGLYEYWNCKLYQTVASEMTTPVNLYLKKFFDIPEVGTGLIPLDILDHDFKEKYNNWLHRMVRKEVN